jgi:hypothetical protein
MGFEALYGMILRELDYRCQATQSLINVRLALAFYMRCSHNLHRLNDI